MKSSTLNVQAEVDFRANLKRHRPFGIAVTLVLVLSTAAASARSDSPDAAILKAPGSKTEAVIYVATDGKDTWSGRLPAPNRKRTDGPLATLERACDQARNLRASGLASSVRILIRGGTYYLPKTLILTPRDSGLVIEGRSGEDVVLSGGRVATGWKSWREHILQADLSRMDLPDLKFRELYFKDQRQPLARVPNFDPKHPRHGWYLFNAAVVEPKTKTKFQYHPGELNPAKWAHPEQAWVISHDSLNYANTWSLVKSTDRANCVIETEKGVYALSEGNPYYLCNLFEELDAPGEWYADVETKSLYFWPPEGDPNHDAVIVPALESLFLLQGDPTNAHFVQSIRISHAAIRHCRGNAVQMTGAVQCTVAGCDFRNVGVGVYLGDDTRACRVVGCDMTQTSGDGVTVLGSSLDHERVRQHIVDNNYIWDFGYGQIHNRCGGVFMARCSHCIVTHNHIHDGPRYAIGMDVGNDCEIAYNHCHHVNLETCDTSIIEGATAWDWGRPDETERNRLYNRGNSIHHNLLHDSGGWGTSMAGQWGASTNGKSQYPHFSWGIYLDLHASGWSVHDNVIYNTVLGAFMLNCGQDNVFENNVCVGGKLYQAFLEPWGKYVNSGNRLERNIFLFGRAGAKLYNLPQYKNQYYHFSNNVIWNGGGPLAIDGVKALKTAATNAWSQWQALGQDQDSVVADPLFRNVLKHDFRLRPDSPALKLGFKPIDLSAVGNYKSPDRRTWPRPEAKVFREAANYGDYANCTH